jgi:hypothetical protein
MTAEWSARAPTDHVVVRSCRNFEKYWFMECMQKSAYDFVKSVLYYLSIRLIIGGA